MVHKEIHPSLLQLMSFTMNVIENNMLNFNEDFEKKKFTIEIIKTITLKTYEEPHIVNLLFS